MGIFDYFKPKKEKLSYSEVTDPNGKVVRAYYISEKDPATEQDLLKVFRSFKLEKHFEVFKPLIRQSIVFASNEKDLQFAPEITKSGGKPVLPLMQNGRVMQKDFRWHLLHR